MSGYYWVQINEHTPFPPSAVYGGHDSNGSAIYVGRILIQEDLVPAKVIPDRKCAYATFGGEEVSSSKYEVLCEEKFEWVHASGGYVRSDAVIGGKTISGEKLYIGRALYSESITIGKIQPSHQTCYISYEGKEISINNYEVLVRRR
ncbi:hypothetical protein GWI33_003112 [Rhynchophorus ferrugineus]|uniref:Uncharacterized protein n=1 Tax=Rhynchophorus ferrugineus TaxID=354439 RepID=A0A834IQF3_RHYFE|nr:hypothetical protein GWI33_003112 [Rhynchophorus ferrugineus]